MTQQSLNPTRRRNALSGKWVLLSPHRMARPWTGQTESISEDKIPAFDANCYLCPGNTRTSGEVNPDYSDTFVFTNDFSALAKQDEKIVESKSELFTEVQEDGICEVVCYSPIHNKNVMHLEIAELEKVVRTFQERYRALGNQKQINHVQIFESRGKEVGNSNLHPHAQIWAQKNIPLFVQEELIQQEAYFQEHGKRLLSDYLDQELEIKDRIVYENESFVILVPYWAEWPYELLILPKKELQSLLECTEVQVKDLAEVYAIVAKLYATVFQRPQNGSTYMMGIHQKPTDNKDYPGFQFHVHFISPMLTPDRQKFQAGYEKFGEPQRDLTPEKAAEFLREKRHAC